MRCGSGLIERHFITPGPNMSSYLCITTLALLVKETSTGTVHGQRFFQRRDGAVSGETWCGIHHLGAF